MSDDIDYDSIIADYADGCAALQSEIDDLAAENKRLRAAQTWQPIETAPKDGRWFCACDEHTAHSYRARWDGHEYESEERHITLKLTGGWSGWSPTHWTYLPDPPWMVPLPEPPK